PASDLSRESIAFRLERLEQGTQPIQAPTADASNRLLQAEESSAEPEPAVEPEPVPVPVGAPGLELSQLQDAWVRTVLPAVEERIFELCQETLDARERES